MSLEVAVAVPFKQRGATRLGEGEFVVARFDPPSVAVPDEYEPDESILKEQSVFERILDSLVAAGHDKREAVAAINERQRRLGISVEAAAALYATRQGVDVGDAAEAAMEQVDE